ITAGATITKPADPTRAGYTFSGWYKDEGYASVWNFATDTVSANTTLYAKWTAIPVATYTVTF
ncbi:InlB B-repeat-containing protein, partial [Paenibacillus silvestris]|uniref:InlB B-repeat-containing protein n=1 Tax=Paenibacillus silvestris TaxID=2606219 RepID=UPI001928F6EE